jgi:hypothetical protein
MYHLTDAETGDTLCQISKKDLQFLSRHLEGDFEEDVEYRLTSEELEQIELYDIGEALDEALRAALEEKNEIFIIWSRA